VSEEAKAVPAPHEPFHPRPPTPVPERPEKKGLSELSRRLLTAAVLVPAVVYIIIVGGLLYLATVALFTLIGQREFYRLIEDKGAHPLVGVGLGFGVAVTVVAYYAGNEYHVTLLLTASLLALMVAQLRKARITEALASISGTFFGVFYVAWLLAHAVLLRFFYRSVVSKYDADDVALLELAPEAGIFFMIYTLAVVVCCDAGAYFAGRAWGRRKLAPEISPNKSVEGALGGVVAGSLAGIVCKLVFVLFWPELSVMLSLEAAAAFGVVLSVVGIVGDLVESLLKRDAAVKDTGALLPGMGGVLDRVDAPLLAIPMMYYMLLGYVFIRVG